MFSHSDSTSRHMHLTPNRRGEYFLSFRSILLPQPRLTLSLALCVCSNSNSIFDPATHTHTYGSSVCVKIDISSLHLLANSSVSSVASIERHTHFTFGSFWLWRVRVCVKVTCELHFFRSFHFFAKKFSFDFVRAERTKFSLFDFVVYFLTKFEEIESRALCL